MFKPRALKALCGLVMALFCQAAVSEALVPLNHLPALAGDYFKLASEELNRPLHIYVRLPEGYADDDGVYPIVYLLDGDSLFPILAANHLFLSYDDKLPEAVVVGIAYGSFDPKINRRGYDFSPPGSNTNPDRGGAEAFQRFLKQELLPKVEQRYRVDPTRRVLFGQSRGGSFVLYSAFTEPDLFWGRIASNPSLEPGRELFYGLPADAERDDLRLVLTSGTQDRLELRAQAEEWSQHWLSAEAAPWAVKRIDIESGTHAADSPASYRAAMRWLFGLDS